MKEFLVILTVLLLGVLAGYGVQWIYEQEKVLAECNKIKQENEICKSETVAKRYKLNEQPNITNPL